MCPGAQIKYSSICATPQLSIISTNHGRTAFASMDPSLLFLLYAAILLSNAHGLALYTPIHTNSTNLLPLHAISPNPILQCTTLRRFQILPLYTDCNAALSQLSSSIVVGSFHTGGAADAFQLPVTQSHASCEVRVHLVFRAQLEASSWFSIQEAAATLSTICSNGRQWGATGGWIRLGPGRGIRVELF